MKSDGGRTQKCYKYDRSRLWSSFGPCASLSLSEAKAKILLLLSCFAIFLSQMLTRGQGEVPQSTIQCSLTSTPRSDAPVGLPSAVLTPVKMSAVPFTR